MVSVGQLAVVRWIKAQASAGEGGSCGQAQVTLAL